LSWPGWLTYHSGRFTHISGRVQNRESSPVKDQRSTTVPRNQRTLSVRESPLSYKKWTSPQGAQVHYTYAAMGYIMTAGGLQLSSLINCLCMMTRT